MSDTDTSETSEDVIKQAEDMRKEIERSVDQDAWNECDLMVGMLGALELDAVICKVKIPSASSTQGEEYSIVPAIAVTTDDFDKLKGLLARLV